VDERAEYISIAEAATLLGVHRNTVRNRVKVGRYKAHKLLTPQGETYAIERESLGLPRATPTNAPAQPLSRPVRHNPDNPAQPAALISPDQHAQADAIVQRLLAPFIAELGTVREELGQVKAERDELRRRVEAAEAERERLHAAQVPPEPPGATEAVSTDNPSGVPSQGFWARVRRVFGGE